MSNQCLFGWRGVTALLLTLLLASVIAFPAQAQTSRSSSTTLSRTDPAAEKAAEMFRSRASATEVAEELRRSFRLDEARTVQLLKSTGFGADAVARAASEAFRASTEATAGHLLAAGFVPSDIASGMVTGLKTRPVDALRAMDAAGVRSVATEEVLRAAQASAAEVATYMEGSGEDLRTTARVITSLHRVSGDELAGPLLSAFGARTVATWLKDDLSFNRLQVSETLVREGVRLSVVEDLMSSIGLAPEPPGVLRWWIRDYSYTAGSSDIIENAEIVNRAAVLQGAGGTDGTVWIEGDNLNDPDVEVWAGTTGASPVRAEIVSRQTMAGGRDRLEVVFPSMPDAGFRVTTPGGDAEVGAAAFPVGYAAVERDLFETALDGLDISIDTDDGVHILFGGETISGDLDEERENGIETRVTDVNSSGFEVATESVSGGAALVVNIAFEESGREFEGRLFGYIPCWKCSTFEVPTSECSSFSINCMMDFLGEGIASLGTCANPANWTEEEILDIQGVPFTGDLSNTTLSVRMAMQVGGAGLSSAGTTYDFATNVSIETSGGDVELDVIDDYVRTRVVDVLTASMSEMDLSVSVVEALNQYAQVLGWGQYLSIEPMPDGRLFVSFPG